MMVMGFILEIIMNYIIGKKDKWKLFQRVVAEDYFLYFENVPDGGVYWLRNLTTGIQERIFILNEGRVDFY